MATRGGAMGISGFASSPSYLNRNPRGTTSQLPLMVSKLATSRRSNISCSALQESSTSTSAKIPNELFRSLVAIVAAETKEVQPAEKPAPAAKAKPAAKAPAKPLPELMTEDVIPTLKSRLEAEDDITELELSFQDNKLEGSFMNKEIPYTFWAFFPNGVLTGPKGFALASHGSDVSTVEPFLVDEKKITANHVVFWVEKRLAAQGIIPVWKE